MKRERNILLDKSQAFAGRIIKMYRYLSTEKKELILSKQVLRSGTSIGANLTESKNAQSKADYLNKQNIALKEADETEFWLKKLLHGDYITQYQYESMYQDNDEIVKILTKIIKTMKSKLNS